MNGERKSAPEIVVLSRRILDNKRNHRAEEVRAAIVIVQSYAKAYSRYIRKNKCGKRGSIRWLRSSLGAREQNRLRCKAWREKNKEKVRKIIAGWQARNPEKWLAIKRRNKYIRSTKNPALRDFRRSFPVSIFMESPKLSDATNWNNIYEQIFASLSLEDEHDRREVAQDAAYYLYVAGKADNRSIANTVKECERDFYKRNFITRKREISFDDVAYMYAREVANAI